MPNGTRVRRQTAWNDELFNVTLGAGLGDEFLIFQDSADSEKRGCTMGRTIIGFDILPADPGVGSGSQRVSLGIALASDDAFAAGALADPETQSDYPVGGWLWRWSGVVRDETLGVGPMVYPRLDLDLRAMRKLDRTSVYMALKNDNLEGTAFTIRLAGLIRILYKLP